jgi:hypothetical protein
MNVETLPLPEYFRLFVNEVASSPLYQAVCAILADLPIVEDLFVDAAPTQRRPNLLLAAMHASLLRDRDHELALWHQTLQGTRSPEDPRLAEAVADLLVTRRIELAETIANGATQTNEVGRSAVILPALAAGTADTGRAVGLVEIGASAGLNLRLDHYRYRYRLNDAEESREFAHRHDASDAVLIDCDVSRSDADLPWDAMASMRIGSRRGLDLNPIDVTDPAQTAWLRALVWPDEVARFARLSAAVELASTVPVVVDRGDAVDELDRLVAGVESSQHPAVITTWVLTYLPEERRIAFAAALDRIGRERDLTWVMIEHAAYASSLPFPPEAAALATTLGNPVVVHRYRSGSVQRQWIATCHPHGRWLRWS